MGQQRLHPDDLAELKANQERLAREQTAQLRAHLDDVLGRDGSGLVTAKVLANDLGVSLDYVYGHKTDLGGVPLGAVGSGKRPRWRFDLDKARRAYADMRKPDESPASPTPRRRRSKASGGAPLLQYDGWEGQG